MNSIREESMQFSKEQRFNRFKEIVPHNEETVGRVNILYLARVAIENDSGVIVVVIVWWLGFQLPMQSVPITTKVVNSNPAHGEVYSMQHFVIKFVSDLRQIGGFLWLLQFPPPINLTATL